MLLPNQVKNIRTNLWPFNPGLVVMGDDSFSCLNPGAIYWIDLKIKFLVNDTKKIFGFNFKMVQA